MRHHKEGLTMNKREKVLNHLLKGGTITKIQALRWWGLLNLGDAIHILRKRRYDIKSVMKKRNGSEYAVYSLGVK